MSNESKNRLKLIVNIVIWTLVIAALFGLSGELFDNLTQLGISIILSAILTFISETILERLGLDILRKIPLSFEIGEFNFSVSLFLILTIIIKILLKSAIN